MESIKKTLMPMAAFATCLLLAFALSGCSSNNDSADTNNESDKAAESSKQTAEIGNSFDITSDYGDFSFSVEGFEINDEATEFYQENGSELSEGQSVGLLLLKVENVSFDDPYNGELIPVDQAVYVEDEEGVSLNVMNSAIDVNGYAGAAGGYVECAQGQTKKAALFYPVEENTANVTVCVFDYEIPIKLESE